VKTEERSHQQRLTLLAKMRLHYAPLTPPESAPQSTRDIYERIAERRHPRPLIPLDLTLLHSPEVANGYNAFVGAIRTASVIPAAVLELAVCRVAVLTNAVWEWEAHSKLAVKAGVSRLTLQEVLQLNKGTGKSRQWEGVNDLQEAVLIYVDIVTKDVNVDDGTWENLRRAFNQRGWHERELVELTVAIAGYNAVSRILVSLNVGERNGTVMKVPDEAA
jgi:AhpD family alkylhydroperoxidase